MTTPDPIILDVDPSAYLANLGRAETATTGFAQTLRGIPVAIGPMQRAMDQITPPRMALVGMAALAGSAASTQAQLARVQAQAKLTGANFGSMAAGMRGLARELPTTNRGAREIYGTLNRLGVVSKGTEKPLNDVSKAVTVVDKNMGKWLPGLSKVTGKVDELFGTRGKMTNPATLGRVKDLAAGFEKLGAATGESSSTVAQGMIRLNQAMGTGLNTKRVMNFNDSLTTLTATSGASASGILEFSRSISPFARASGIGQTATMGISAAFSKMGEDGYAAANAVGKILGDMSRATREGTPQMAAYAQMVGKTTEEFQTLFKTNPAEALTQVTEALGKDPTNAPRMLESVGLDGVRTQRALQQLSQSGNLRSTIATATSAYGSGSTERAAAEAMDGLFDSAQRAAAAGEQLSEALGAPLLTPLTFFSDQLGAVASGMAQMAGNGGVQAVLKGLAMLSAGILLASKLIKPVVVASGVGQAVTSSPFRSGLGALAMGMGGGDADKARGTWAGRLGGNRVIDAMGRNEPLSSNQRMNEMGQRIFSGRLNAVGGFIGQGGGGRGLFGQVGNLAALGMGSYMRMQAETMRQFRTPMEMRDTSQMRAYGQQANAFGDRVRELGAQRESGAITRSQYWGELRKSFNDMRTNVNAAGGSVRTFSQQLMRGSASMAYQGGRTAMTMGGRGLVAGAARLGGAFGGLPGVAIMGGMIGYQQYRAVQNRREEETDRRANATSFIDDYRVAMGKATEATSTFAGRLASAAEAVAKGTTSLTDALTIDRKDMEAAAGIDKPIRTFSARTGAGAGRMLAVENATKAYAPDELTRISYDLINQYGEKGARQAMEQLQAGGGEGALTQSTDLSGAVNELVSAKDRGGVSSWKRRFDLNRLPNWTGLGDRARGTGMYTNTLSDETRADTDTLAQGVKTRRAVRSEQYGEQFGAQEARKEMDQAIKVAMDRGDNAQVQELVHAFQEANQLEAKDVSWADIEKAGGFSSYMARGNKSWEENYGKGDEAPVEAKLQAGWVAERLGGNQLRQFFDKSQSVVGAKSVQALLNQPESPLQQQETLQTLVKEAQATGMSLSQLSTEAGKAAAAHGNSADAAHKLMMAMQGAAAFLANVQSSFETEGQTAMGTAERNAGNASLQANDPVTVAAREQGLAGLAQGEQQAVMAARQRLTAQREYQVQSGRMAEDFADQKRWSAADYQRGLERMEFDYNKNRLRSQKAFELQSSQSTEDYQRNRKYSMEDFARSLARMARDAARAMYDPFQRIQVQPTWDVRNLLGNLDEQLQAIEQQVKNLATVRKAGLSDAVISMLGLNDPKNAQQLATMVDELVGDASLVSRLNSNVAKRDVSGAALFDDPANVQREQQVEDFERQMGRQDAEFERMMKRGRTQFQLSMTYMAKDQAEALRRGGQDRDTAVDRTRIAYEKATRRMSEDLKRADEVITGDLAQLTDAMNRALKGQFVDFQDLTKNGMKDWVTVLEKYKDGWHELLLSMGTDLEIKITERGGSGEQNAVQREKEFARGSRASGEGQGWQAQWGAVQEAFPDAKLNSAVRPGAKTSSGNVSYHALGRAIDVSPSMEIFNWIAENYPNSKELIFSPAGKKQIKNGQPYNYGGEVKAQHWKHVHWAMANGGRVIGQGSGTSDDINARLSNGEYVLKAAAAGVIGFDNLDRLNSVASRADLQAMASNAGATYITYDSSTSYEDHGTHVHGDVTVLADDPQVFFKAMAEKKARDNMTAAPQRKR